MGYIYSIEELKALRERGIDITGDVCQNSTILGQQNNWFWDSWTNQCNNVGSGERLSPSQVMALYEKAISSSAQVLNLTVQVQPTKSGYVEVIKNGVSLGMTDSQQVFQFNVGDSLKLGSVSNAGFTFTKYVHPFGETTDRIFTDDRVDAPGNVVVSAVFVQTGDEGGGIGLVVSNVVGALRADGTTFDVQWYQSMAGNVKIMVDGVIKNQGSYPMGQNTNTITGLSVGSHSICVEAA